jgi:acyl-CoA thioester hydrolase
MQDPDPIAGRMTDGGHQLRQRVYFEDTDFSGGVYHARYLQFLERGRSDYLRLLGIHHRELAATGRSFAVSRMEIAFLKPASIDDILMVCTEFRGATGARITLHQRIMCDEEDLVKASVIVALVGPNGRAVRLPPGMRAVFGAKQDSSA